MVRHADPALRLFLTVALLGIALAVILSYDWTNGGFTPGASATFLVAGLVAVIVVLAVAVIRSLNRPPRRFCPSCGREIPFDARGCPCCSAELP